MRVTNERSSAGAALASGTAAVSGGAPMTKAGETAPSLFGDRSLLEAVRFAEPEVLRSWELPRPSVA
jgi:hypothetical protein